ncbi:hypothetical protein GCM10010532_055700 [Dactylosporangium siamense]|uniref:Uncharacterized protein n=1 Tax=Dactylosporangium siamense TaxID=685454 RepID=A0A919PP42_9ACTN|nr:hypothetical protein Dsi01nite_039760 [Dactylosporangium siamense]
MHAGRLLPPVPHGSGPTDGDAPEAGADGDADGTDGGTDVGTDGGAAAGPWSRGSSSGGTPTVTRPMATVSMLSLARREKMRPTLLEFGCRPPLVPG